MKEKNNRKTQKNMNKKVKNVDKYLSPNTVAGNWNNNISIEMFGQTSNNRP